MVNSGQPAAAAAAAADAAQPPAYGLAPTPGGGWVPVPDPTALTTAQLRRELATLRELVEAQIQTASAALTARLDAMDEANGLRLDGMREVPAVIREQIAHLKELHDERFSSIALQFTERDVRTQQSATASKDALDAALLAAKELVGQQNTSNVEVAAKAEAAFTKQIEQLGTIISTVEKSLTDRLGELKERIDRGEGADKGIDKTRGSVTSNVMVLVMSASMLIALISVIAFVLKK